MNMALAATVFAEEARLGTSQDQEPTPEADPFSSRFNPLHLNNFDLEWKRLSSAVVLPPIGPGNCPLAPLDSLGHMDYLTRHKEI